MVIWITGLPNAGKTTFAKALVEKLRKDQISCVHLDGDDLRAILNVTDRKFARTERMELATTYSKLAKHLSDQGITVVVSTVSLFHAVQDWNRTEIEEYIEIFLTGETQEFEARGRSYGSPLPKWGKELTPEFPKTPDFTFTPSPREQLSSQILTITTELFP